MDSAGMYFISCASYLVEAQGSIILFSGTMLDRSHPHFIDENTKTQRSPVSCTGSSSWWEFYFFFPPLYYSIPSQGYFNHYILTYFPVKLFSPQTREPPRPMTTKMPGISLDRGFGSSCSVHSQAECRVETLHRRGCSKTHIDKALESRWTLFWRWIWQDIDQYTTLEQCPARRLWMHEARCSEKVSLFHLTHVIP